VRAVSHKGTAAYDDATELPPLVASAVALARRTGFETSCLPAQGALLAALAAGVGPGVIGETGTGCGVGLAWLASRAHPAARLASIEQDPERAAAAAAVFRDVPAVVVRTGDWSQLHDRAPFDLLVLDGGGQGKGTEAAIDPRSWLRPGGLVVIDDFTPSAGWPPRHGGALDMARIYWLRHPWLQAAEIRVAPDSATIVASYCG
jgi:predicted O-methyltransferase YrrM